MFTARSVSKYCGQTAARPELAHRQASAMSRPMPLKKK
jgi:hypothetical protein